MGKGTGDLYIKCFSSDPIIASEIYEVEDCYKANLSASYSFGTSDTKYKIYEILIWDSYEIEGNLKSTVNNRFSLGLKLNNDNASKGMCRIGAYTSIESVILGTDGSTISAGNGGSYTANTNMKIKFAYDNGNMKLYANDVLITEHSIDFYPTYIVLHSYSSSKTVSVSNIKIKPL